MLIINADDWGRSKAATDSAMICYERGRISSTTAMVFMEDSLRAAEIARDIKISTGLHLNFSEKFTLPSIPEELRKSQAQVCRFLNMGKFALILYNPALRKQFSFLFRAQLNEFVKLYGKEPSHVDGHQHMHLCSNLLFDHVIPKGTKLRRSFSFRPGEKGFFQRSYRAFVDLRLVRRHRLTDYFFALAHHLPMERLRSIVNLAADHSVEIMTHPQLSEEFECLIGSDYANLIKTVPVGSYSSL